ncbi:hypothetical protein SGCZBJ_17240 [Caulobacter zeae]|uniref:Uncharacterized protein n=1 Tax=Caulobacter zeae TaxID=2055137 RepID=A0A2N5DA14_9CAUL|nr:ribbon-helix-helix protein, CopG family [Caulobacter zeae]PLR22914.1 hypothetical protein SGCZBJ_17240 [Caulobacter zeae]
MKFITVEVDDETYRRVSIKAADTGTSIEAMVRQFLMELGRGDGVFRASDNVPRDELYRRGG